MTNKENKTSSSKNFNDTIKNAGAATSNFADKDKDIVGNSKKAIINVVDMNGNGEIDVEDFIILGLRTPGIKVNRIDFLQKELMKNHPQEIVFREFRRRLVSQEE